ncbi:hypothetical protein JXB02_00315 [Candidatus Woesearchaeota archaeon]|nr:hypothetical protein [Candidatus Woesearchaeota archaeon]
MRNILTKDGSFTLYSEEHSEYYHSLTGAEEEAREKYAQPGVAAIRGKDRVRVLDVCFGLGYNTAAFLDMAEDEMSRIRVEAVGLENDPAVLREILTTPARFRSYPRIRAAVRGEEPSIRIILGDARQTILQAGGPFDLVFFDPFSPKRQPELWSEAFFREIAVRMAPGALLATYSCAKAAREHMGAAGLSVADGPVVKRWAPGTIARKV